MSQNCQSTSESQHYCLLIFVFGKTESEEVTEFLVPVFRVRLTIMGALV